MVMYEDEDSRVNAALAADEHRGVKVRVLLNGGYYGEGSAQNRAAYSYLRARSVPVRWTPSYFALTHQKTLARRRPRVHPDLQPHSAVLRLKPRLRRHRHDRR